MREPPPEIRDEAVYGALGWAYLGLSHLHTIDRAIFPQVVAVAVRHRDLVVARCEHIGLLRRWGRSSRIAVASCISASRHNRRRGGALQRALQRPAPC